MPRLLSSDGRPMTWDELHELRLRICAEKASRPHTCPPGSVRGNGRGLSCRCECHA